MFQNTLPDKQIRIRVKSTTDPSWNGRVADKYELFLALEYEKGNRCCYFWCCCYFWWWRFVVVAIFGVVAVAIFGGGGGVVVVALINSLHLLLPLLLHTTNYLLEYKIFVVDNNEQLYIFEDFSEKFMGFDFDEIWKARADRLVTLVKQQATTTTTTTTTTTPKKRPAREGAEDLDRPAYVPFFHSLFFQFE